MTRAARADELVGIAYRCAAMHADSGFQARLPEMELPLATSQGESVSEMEAGRRLKIQGTFFRMGR
jgi:hypothetical protein